MRILRVISISLILSMYCGALFAQSDLDRQNRRRRDAERRLEEIKGLIGSNTGDIRKSETALKLTRNGIEAKREIVAALDEEIAHTTAEINVASRRARSLDSTLTALKKDYGGFVRSAWKNHKMNNTTAFLLASRDFNDATRRISHIRRYNAARARKGVEIDSLNTTLKKQIEEMTLRKAELDKTKTRRNAELASLKADETKYDGAIAELKKDRKKLDAQAKKERENIAAAQRQIDKIIAAQAKAEKAKGKQSQAEIVLSGKFEENKGKLPWPVEGGGPGAVLDRFGKERMADGIEKDSKGIIIATRRGAGVKAVFEGKVTGVYSVGQFEKCVTVRSGSYVVLYGNISTTNLKNGDTVPLNGTIGSINDSDDADRHRLIFQIWRETTPLDPEQWMRK